MAMTAMAVVGSCVAQRLVTWVGARSVAPGPWSGRRGAGPRRTSAARPSRARDEAKAAHRCPTSALRQAGRLRTADWLAAFWHVCQAPNLCLQNPDISPDRRQPRAVHAHGHGEVELHECQARAAAIEDGTGPTGRTRIGLGWAASRRPFHLCDVRCGPSPGSTGWYWRSAAGWSPVRIWMPGRMYTYRGR